MQPLRGYCITCKGTRELRDPKQVDRGGGPAIEATCVDCGKTVFVLGAGVPVRANGSTN
ncbi:MAG: hypothetical protein JOZ24_00380 [Candidatus Eremiobacteraeota bacterium]|nr:hypothetical protein [Candidatus Eremiobacteraeota bacterium]